MASSSSSLRSSNSHSIQCFHGFVAKIRRVRKGPNLGARFYGCPNWPNDDCAFFKWEKDCEDELQLIETEQLMKDLAEMKKKSELKKQQYKAQINNLKLELKKAAIREKNLFLMLCMPWTIFVMYVALVKNKNP